MKQGLPTITRSLYLLFRFELMLLTSSTTLPLFVGGFLCFLSITIFLVGDFLNTNLATLSTQWQFLPWILIIFIPAFSINAFNRQIHSGSQDLELSYPFSELTIVLAKWLSGLAVFVIILLLTFPLVATVEYLGSPDWGAILAGYLGALLMICLFHSIALFASSIVQDQIGSFLLGSGIIFLLILCDLQFLQSPSMPKQMQLTASYLYLASPKHWLDEISSGRIDIAALCYFVIFTFFVITLTHRQVKTFRNPPKVSYLSSSISVLGLIVSCFFSSYCSALLNNRAIVLDLTEYREFSLQPETLNLANKSSEVIKVTLYLSEDVSTVPKAITQHMARVSSMLETLSRVSDQKLRFEIKKLEPDTIEADEAELLGIRHVPMSSGDSFFFGALFESDGRQLTVDYFDINQAKILEYEIALRISNLSKTKIAKVSVISSLFKPTHIKKPHPDISVIEELKTQYDVEIIPYFSSAIPETDLLVVIDAPILKKEMLSSIDQHITKGKPAVILIDPYQRMNPKNLALNINESKSGEINSLLDLLTSYGLKFSKENVTGDLENAATVQTQDGRQYQYPFWLRLSSNNLSTSNPITANLNELYFPEPGSFSIEETNLIFEPLIFTGNKAGEIINSEISQRGTEFLAKTFIPSQSEPLTIGAYLSGKIRSPFNNYVSDNNAALILVADVDWIYDIFARSGKNVTTNTNDNVALFMNIIEYLSGDPNLLSVRSSGDPIRRFKVIEDLLLEAQKKYQSIEVQYLERLSESERVISEVLSMANVDRIDQLPNELAEQTREFKANTYPIKQQLREIRREMKSEINALFVQITILNLVSGPILAVFLYLTVRRLRFFRYRKRNF